jgi:hypothetical protein
MPSQDNENAMDGLLRQSLSRDSAAAGDCPDAELLAAYFDQALGADEAAGYELHFSTCPRCRAQLAAMARVSTQQILQPDLALEPALAGARPAQVIALEAARTHAQVKPAASPTRSETKFPERKSPDARWLDLRWLIPVAAMLVLGTLVFMRFASRETTVGPNQVAMSKSTPPPQDQTTLEPEKKASDAATPERAAPKNQPSATSAPTRSRSSIPSATGAAPNPQSASAQRSEGTFSRSGTASRSVGAVGSRHPAKTEKAPVYVFHSPEWRTTEAPADRNPRKEKFPTEPAPAPPAPELNASMPSIVVATSSADAVKSPAPAPPPSAATKTQGFGLGGKNFHNSAATKSAAKAKPAEEGYTETVISTPDSDVFYRIAGGGFVEISEDGGATWQRQLLNPSAEFTAGSAPEPRICWLVGRSGIVFVTEDGKSWRKLPSPTSEDLVVVLAKSASNATVTANDNRKWSTDDAGKNWHPVK